MARKRTPKIEFSSPATVAELIEAAEDLRAAAGPDALVRTVADISGGLSFKGYHISAITVDETPNGAES